MADYSAVWALIDLRSALGLLAFITCVTFSVFLWRRSVRVLDMEWMCAVLLILGSVAIAIVLFPPLREQIPAHEEPPVEPVLAETAPVSISIRDDKDFTSRSYVAAKLASSTIVNSKLQDIDFSDADLHESDLRASVFASVDFSGSNLCAVDARGADFSQARNLSSANTRYMLYDIRTKFPSDFDPNRTTFLYRDTGRPVLYTCNDVEVRSLQTDGSRR